MATSTLFLSSGVGAYSYLSAYDRIMLTVVQRDEDALKKMVLDGVNINAPNAFGETALCTVLRRQDAQGYKMLYAQGATVHTPCIRQIPPPTLSSFYLSHPEFGRYVNGQILVPDMAIQSQRSSSGFIGGIPWPHVGEFVLAGAAVGIVALIGSGGGGGGSTPVPGYDSSLFKPVDTGLNLDDFPFLGRYWLDTTETFSSASAFNEYARKYYDDLSKNNPDWDTTDTAREYNSWYNWSSYQVDYDLSDASTSITYHLKNPIAILPMVNAASAWVRGYTGYVVDRSDVNNPKITNDKVKVAVMDTGLEWGAYAHNQLKANISSTRLNFAYGPCSVNNSEKCWAFNETTGKAYLTSGTDQIITTTPSSTSVDMAELDETGEKSARQLWNEYAGQYAPQCSPTVTTNCLRVDTTTSETVYTATYYPQGTYTTSTTSDGTITYSIRAELWTEYKAKYGEKGYKYDENDSTPGLLVDDDLYSSENHGTHVAGVLGAVQDGYAVSGVAPNVEIIPVRADFQMNQVMNHLKDVVETTDAQVINLSLGSEIHLGQEAYDYYKEITGKTISSNKDIWDGFFSSDVKAGYQAAADKGTVLVFAAGNESSTQPSIHVVAPLVGESDDNKTNYAKSIYKNLLISVVALDENKKIAEYSNRCGQSSMYCLAAPGGSKEMMVASTSLGQEYALMSGTSQATPVITGSVALLMGAFPFLKPQEVVQILFETADYIKPVQDATSEIDEIADYNKMAWLEAGHETTDDMPDTFNPYADNTEEGKYNAIYGHGLVNLDKATDPIGVPKISFDTVASSPLAMDASLTSVNVPISLSRLKSALPQNIVVLDKYSRPYAMPTTRFVNSEKRSDALKRSFHSFMAMDEKVVQANDHLSFGFTSAPSDSTGLPAGAMTMQMKPSKDMQIRMGYTQDTQSFGGNYSERIVQNPFMNMRQAWGSDVAYRVAGNWSLTGGLQYGQNGFIDSEVLDKMSDKPMVSVVKTGVRYAPKKSFVFDMSFGQMNEEESLLGLRGAGAFETDGNKTKFISFGATILPFDKWQLSASYTYGMTQANAAQTLMKFSRLTSDAFAFAALYRPDETKTYGFKVVSPLRVRSGTVTFNLPTARDMYADRLYRTQFTADMKPDAREYDLSLFFMNQLKSDLYVAGEAGVRLHPEHQKEAKPDWRGLFNLKYNY